MKRSSSGLIASSIVETTDQPGHTIGPELRFEGFKPGNALCRRAIVFHNFPTSVHYSEHQLVLVACADNEELHLLTWQWPRWQELGGQEENSAIHHAQPIPRLLQGVVRSGVQLAEVHSGTWAPASCLGTLCAPTKIQIWCKEVVI